MVGLVAGIFTIDNRYITKDYQKVYAQSVDAKFEFEKQQRLTEQYYQMRQMQRKYPKDVELKEDLKAVQSQRNVSKKTLENLNNNQKAAEK